MPLANPAWRALGRAPRRPRIVRAECPLASVQHIGSVVPAGYRDLSCRPLPSAPKNAVAPSRSHGTCARARGSPTRRSPGDSVARRRRSRATSTTRRGRRPRRSRHGIAARAGNAARQPRPAAGRAAYEYCKNCHPGAIAGRWTRDQVIAAMRAWRDRYGRPPSSYDWSRTHATRRGDEAASRLADGDRPAPRNGQRPVRHVGGGARGGRPMTAPDSATDAAATTTGEGFDELGGRQRERLHRQARRHMRRHPRPARACGAPRDALPVRVTRGSRLERQTDEVLVVSVHQLVGELRNNRGERAATRLPRPDRQPDITSSLHRLGLAASPTASGLEGVSK